jgi:hypothetical protein
MIENWNHGRGVGCFFPLFSCKRGVSSSIAVVIRIGRKKREQKKNGYLFPSLMVRLQVQKPTWPNINLPQLSVGDPGENT